MDQPLEALEREEPAAAPSASARSLLLIWLRISISSFGGGAATLGLIRQEFVTRRKWVAEEHFLRQWSLCQLAPGINLIALAILLGRRMGGPSSIAAALVGLLLPSFVVAVCLSAAYSHFIHSPFLVAARAGVLPAVAGIGLATVVSLLRPVAKKHWRSGWEGTLFFGALVMSCFFAMRLWRLSPVFILIGAGALGALFNLLRRKENEG